MNYKKNLKEPELLLIYEELEKTRLQLFGQFISMNRNRYVKEIFEVKSENYDQ